MNDSPQFIRTDKAIMHAMISLLKVKPFEKITVQDILENTPVTRATFYRHYHDKYEIVEKMQDDFFESQRIIREHLIEGKAITPHLISVTTQNQELKETLLKVRTEKVDIWRVLAEETKKSYMERYDAPDKEVEAQMYAHVLTAFRLAGNKEQEFSYEYMHETIITVFLRLLGIEDDNNLKKVLLDKAGRQKK